ESRFAGTENVRVIAGSAERSGVPPGSADLVTAAQAFHWFDPEAFAREVQRIQARPAAWALVWNVRDPEANRFTAEYEAILHRWGDGYGDIRASWGRPDTVGRFSEGPTDRRLFENILPLGLDAARANLASCSFMPPAGSAKAAEALAALDELFDREAVGGRVDLVYRTLVMTPASGSAS
ncbi:MAG: methyltransferase domain-containing protein, partial [Gemmatimonadetes bacterium]|nr:methyltransferase domain-containing protein [Gemmatimonadota bacterium]